MKPELISNSEKAFISDIVSNKQLRLDGRSLNEFRPMKINFGSEWGSVHVSLGETRVLAQVTCEVSQPKSTRPNEGILYIKVELGPMAAPHFEASRISDLGVQVNRILERAFKDSRCVDLESLCIIAEEKVWTLRVDLNVLNHEGNIIDITTTGDEFIIHTHAEKDPIPIVLHHYPVCISYAIFNNGNTAIADPTFTEERVAEANLVFGLNSYRELCGLHFGGITLTSSELLLQCSTRGASRAFFFFFFFFLIKNKYVVVFIKEALRIDEINRSTIQLIAFAECVRMNKITSLKQDRLSIKLKHFKLNEADESDNDDVQDDSKEDIEDKVEKLDATSAILIPHKWIPEGDFESSIYDVQDFEMTVPVPPGTLKKDAKENKTKKKKKKRKKNKAEDVILVVSSDSEEEETVTLRSTKNNVSVPSSSKTHIYFE